MMTEGKKQALAGLPLKSVAEHIEEMNIPGIYPLTCNDIQENDYRDEDYIKEYLEYRSGYEFEPETIRFFIEAGRLDGGIATLYQFLTKKGLITRMRKM